jgi:hypothetical protein
MKYKKLKLFLSFYKNFFVASQVVTILCASILMRNGLGTIVYLFWFKVFTSGVFVFFVNELKNNEFIYYQKLGISKGKLWSVTLSLDLIIFLVGLIAAIYDFKA